MRALALAALLAACSSDGSVADPVADVGTGAGGDTGGDTGTSEPQGAAGRFFAPYVDAAADPTPRLGDVAEATGLRFYVLGHVTAAAADDCTPTWGGGAMVEMGPATGDGADRYTLYEHVNTVRMTYHGDVMVSFGGPSAAGTPLATACGSADDLAAAWGAVATRLGLAFIDLDLDAAALADAEGLTRRFAAAARLQADEQAAGRTVQVWLTLPATAPAGLSAAAVAALGTALDEGVDVAGVNATVGAVSASASGELLGAVLTQLGEQLDAHGVAKTEAERRAMVGVTPTIGRNPDDAEVFGLADAEALVTAALTAGVGRLSMRSLDRDHACPERAAYDPACSAAPGQTEDWQFTQALNGFNTPP